MTTITRTECEVADQIVRWFQVQEGEAVLNGGDLHLLERMWPVTPSRPELVGVRLLREGQTRDFVVNSNSLTAVRRYVETDPVDEFQVHADEEGDLRLLCPRAEDLGCLFAAEVPSGATLAQITEKARTHTGDEAESAHDFIRTINGEDVAATPAAGEGKTDA